MAGVNPIANPLGKTSILSVTIPEIKKRRVPNKFYVYKIMVQWSNSQSVVVYRRYSNFFDFWCKLKELHTSLLAKSFRYADNPVPLPEMPGKIFLGRSQTHQVAQKRQKKLEEFCQQLIRMPSEISQSTVVYGFFSLWPDDSISAHEVRRNTASGHNVIKPDMTSSVQIPSPSFSEHLHPLLSAKSTSAAGSVTMRHDALEGFGDFRKPRAETIDVTDFMEEEREAEPTYQAVSSYSRLDAQQVDLREGQVVRVIEKHDTGWWMVEASFEQGYVPASLLEPLDDTEKRNSQEDAVAEPDEYVVLEKFDSTADDELNLLPGDIVTTVSIKMDGWWKIKRGSKVGYAPSAILMKKGIEEITRTLTRESQLFLNDITLLRSSRRFPPRHYSTSSTSRGSVRMQQRKVATVEEDKSDATIAESTVTPYDTPRSTPVQGLTQGPDYRHEASYDIPRSCKGPGLPPGIEYRYEWCSPIPEAPQSHYEMDTREELSSTSPDASAQPNVDQSIYQVPRSVAANSNQSNNQDEISAENTDGKIDIYSNLDFSHPGIDTRQAHSEQKMATKVTGATTADEKNSKVLRPYTSSSSIEEPISTVDPELLVSLGLEEVVSHVPKRQDGAEQSVVAEKTGQISLVPPPRIPRSQTVASPPAQGGVSRPAISSGVRKPPPPPPQKPKLKNFNEKRNLPRVTEQERDDSSLIKQQNRDSAASIQALQNRPLPSAPGVIPQSTTRFPRPPPPPPAPYSRKQPVSSSNAEKPSVHRATVVGRPLPDPPSTSMKGRPLPSLPRDRAETDAMRARPLPAMLRSRPPVSPAHVPPRVLRAPDEGLVRDQSDTAPTQFADVQGEYWKMGSACRTLPRSDSGLDNEYIYIDEDNIGLPGSGGDSVHGAVEGSMEQIESPSNLEEKSSPTPQFEETSTPLPTSRVLSTEPLNESTQTIASKTILEHDRVPSPHSPAMLVSEGAEDFLPHSPVDYLNISSDILDGGMEGQVYQNVIHPESEYLNYRFVPSPKPTNHLGIFTAITSSDQTDECMRVKVRDRGELLAESKEWWYMRIDGEEGWTPKEIWEPTPETRALQQAGGFGPNIPKKKSFSAADGVKPKAPPPKPRRVFEHIPETSEEPQERATDAPGADRRQLPAPSITDLPGNRVPSPSNGTATHSNGMTSPTDNSQIQRRPLPEPPADPHTGQYVCNVTLSLDLQPWFYKAMDRPEAERLLRLGHVRNREFLVRERPRKPGYYALSVRHHYSIRHFNIDPNPDGSYSIGQRSFDSLPDIILHYQKHSLFMEGSGSNQSPVTIVRPAKLLRMVERTRSNTSLQ